MSATREYRNACSIEDAVTAIGATILVAEHLHSALACALPDDFPAIDFSDLRAAQVELQKAVES